MKNRRLVIMIVAYALILILIGIAQPREIDWRPTFGAGDKIPFGTYILHDRLKDFFGADSVTTSTGSIHKTLHKKNYRNTNYIFVSQNFSPTRSDVRELLQFADEGNNVFVSSQYMAYGFLDTLGLKIVWNDFDFLKSITPKDSAKSLKLTLDNPMFKDSSPYLFERKWAPVYFAAATGGNDHGILKMAGKEITQKEDEDSTGRDSTIAYQGDEDTAYHPSPLASEAIILGTVANEHPIFVRIPYGKGNIYLHCYPFAFSNYYLLRDSTRGYAEKCISYLPKWKVISDEHTDPRYRHQSTLGFILTNDSLRWAYYTGMLFMLIFVLFSIKRRQRIIPVVDPFRNTTLEFTETVGRLYFNRGDHHDLAEKKIRHFLEYVRSRYYIDTQDLNEEYINKLAAKSGLEVERVKYMTQVMKGMMQKGAVADSELIQLNELIEYFKKHSN